MAHLLLELQERLTVIDQAKKDRFPVLLTQETLADMMGLSVVHVNRILQELRRQNLLHLDRGLAHLPDRRSLAELATYNIEPRSRS